MNINDIVTDWLSDKNELQKYQLDFCQYFKRAILSTQNKNRTYFGTKKGSISLIVGGIYLAAWVASGKDKGLWMIIDNNNIGLGNRTKITISIVKSTKSKDFDLFWLHTDDPQCLKIISDDNEIWESYQKASKDFFNTRHGNFIRKDFIEGKWPIKDFVPNDIEMLDDTKKLDDEFNKQIERSKKDKGEDRLERLKKADTIPDKIYLRTSYFKRNPDVVVEVLLRANGICERCNKPAPFIRISDNTPYLEVHHLEPLAAGGGDTTENAIALCPNCHRELHFGV